MTIYRLAAPKGVDDTGVLEPNVDMLFELGPKPPLPSPNDAFDAKVLFEPKAGEGPGLFEDNDPNPEVADMPAPNELFPIDEPNPVVPEGEPKAGALFPNPEGFPKPLTPPVEFGVETNGLAFVTPNPPLEALPPLS